MFSLKTGYLLKKKYVTYQSDRWEVFEFIDYIAGITFTNTAGMRLCNILTGSNAGLYAYILKEDSNEGEDIFCEDDINKAIENNDYRVNFSEIRKFKISNANKYYLRNDSGEGITPLVHPDLLKYLEDEEKKLKYLEDEEKKQNNEEDYSNACNRPNNDDKRIIDIYPLIKKTIFGQDSQIEEILMALTANEMIVNSSLDLDLIPKIKETILVYGSTGTGKTEIFRRISKLYDIPVVIGNSNLLSSRADFKTNLIEMLKDLYLAADSDIERAEKGILVLDNFDTLIKTLNVNDKLFLNDIQKYLLTLINGTELYLNDKKFDTSRLTVVFLANFYYSSTWRIDDYLIDYGINSELLQCFSKKISMRSLEKDNLIDIIKFSDLSPLRAYEKLFNSLNFDFKYDDEVVNWIAEEVYQRCMGAHALKFVLDEVMKDILVKTLDFDEADIALKKVPNYSPPKIRVLINNSNN